MTACSTKGCENEARCAIRTTRATRANLATTLYYDDRVAPKTAAPYCKACATTLLPSLCAIIGDDAPVAADPRVPA